jgi:hypothetical protein
MKQTTNNDLSTEEPFYQVSYVRLRICDQGHAQLHPSLKYKPVILLDSFARTLSPRLDVQEFVERSCSMNSYDARSCWSQLDGETQCDGQQRVYHIWATIPSILIFDHEGQGTNGTSV